MDDRMSLSKKAFRGSHWCRTHFEFLDLDSEGDSRQRLDERVPYRQEK